VSTTKQFDTAMQRAGTFLLRRNISGAWQAVRSLEPVQEKLTPDQTAWLFNMYGLIENLDASLTPNQAQQKRESAIVSFEKAHDAVGHDREASATAARILTNHAICLLGMGRAERNSWYFDLARAKIDHGAQHLSHRYNDRCQEFLLVNGLRGEAIRQSNPAAGEQIIQKTLELLARGRAGDEENIAHPANHPLDWLLQCDGIVYEPATAGKSMRCHALNGKCQPRPFTVIVPR
jgi:hypothetical protein